MDFIARTAELGLIEDYIKGDINLNGKIVSVFGPGEIGKSALCEKFITIFINNGYIPFFVNFKDVNSDIELLQILINSSGLDFPIYLKQIERIEKIFFKQNNANKLSSNRLLKIISGGTGAVVGGAVGTTLAGPIGTITGTIAGSLLGPGISETGKLITEESIHATLKQFEKLDISEADARFFMNPNELLLNSFLADLYNYTQLNHIVLIFDEYERNINFDKLIREHIIEKHQDIFDKLLLIISSREKLGYEWLKLEREIIPLELEPLEKEDSLLLADSFDINKEVSEEIATASLGIPGFIVANARLYKSNETFNLISYSKELDILDENHLKRIFDHLTQMQRNTIELGALPREFNKTLIDYLLNKQIDDQIYNSILNLSFVGFNSVSNLFYIKDFLRNTILRHYKLSNQDKYLEYNKILVKYYTSEIQKKEFVSIINYTDLHTKIVYHSFEVGIEFGQQVFTNLFNLVAGYPNYLICEALINELVLCIQAQKCEPYLEYYFKGRLYYLRSDWDSAIINFTKLNNEINPKNIHLKALAHMQLGRIYFHRGNLSEAFEIISAANEDFIYLGDFENILVSFNHLGRITRRLRNSTEPEMYHNKVLEIADDKPEFYVHVMEAYRCMSRIYRDRGMWDMAINYCNRSIEIAKKNHKKYDEALAGLRKAELNCYQYKLKDAELDIISLLPSLIKFENYLAVSFAYQILLRISINIKSEVNIYENYVKSLAFALMINANTAIIIIRLELCRYYVYTFKINSASNLLKTIIDDVLKTSDTSLILETYLLNVEFLILINELKEAENILALVAKYKFEQNIYYNCLLELQKNIHQLLNGKNTLDGIKKLRNIAVKHSYKDIELECDILKSMSVNKLSENTENELHDLLLSLNSLSPLKANYIKRGIVPKIYKQLTNDKDKLSVNDQIKTIDKTSSLPKPNKSGKLVIKNPLLALNNRQMIFALHHGITENRLNNFIQGQDDTLLSNSKLEQNDIIYNNICDEILKSNIKPTEFVIYYSPSLRCIETASHFCKIFYKRFNYFPKNIYDNRLKNVCMGEWEGKKKDALLGDSKWRLFKKGTNSIIKGLGSGKNDCIPESIYDVLIRSYEFFNEIISKNKNAVIIGHKISCIVPATLFFTPSQITKSGGIFDWRELQFKNNEFILFKGSSI